MLLRLGPDVKWTEPLSGVSLSSLSLRKIVFSPQGLKSVFSEYLDHFVKSRSDPVHFTPYGGLRRFPKTNTRANWENRPVPFTAAWKISKGFNRIFNI